MPCISDSHHFPRRSPYNIPINPYLFHHGEKAGFLTIWYTDTIQLNITLNAVQTEHNKTKRQGLRITPVLPTAGQKNPMKFRGIFGIVCGISQFSFMLHFSFIDLVFLDLFIHYSIISHRPPDDGVRNPRVPWGNRGWETTACIYCESIHERSSSKKDRQG